MKRRQWAVLAAACLCLALCGCRSGDTQSNCLNEYNNSEVTHEPAPPEKTPQQVLEEQLFDDTHDAFLVDTGGSRGTLLVTAEQTGEWRTWDEEWAGCPIRLSVWDPTELEQPLQTIETASQDFLQARVMDVDFDGSEDITVMTTQGVQAQFYACWRWNEAQGQFVALPAYAGIISPMPNAQVRTIYSWHRASALGDGESALYQWVDGELVCVRRIEVYQHGDLKGPWLLTVEDRVDGDLAEVFRAEFPFETGDFFMERTKWEDPSYHGEES